MLRNSLAPLTLIAALTLVLAALAFVPADPAPHADATTIAAWMLQPHV